MLHEDIAMKSSYFEPFGNDSNEANDFVLHEQKQSKKASQKSYEEQFPEQFEHASVQQISAKNDATMGLFNRLRLDKVKSIEAYDVAKKAVHAASLAEYDLIKQQLAASLDITKKRVYLSYLEQNATLKSDIQRLEHKARQEISELLVELQGSIFATSNTLKNQVKNMNCQEEFSQEQLEFLNQTINGVEHLNLKITHETFELLIKNHRTMLHNTLKTFLKQLDAKGL